MFKSNFYSRKEQLQAALIFFLLLVPAALSAQIRLRDPGFPSSETITYRRSSDTSSERVEMRLRLVEGTAEPYYEYKLLSDSQDITAKLDPATLAVFFSEVWEKNEHSTVHRVNEVLKNEKPVKTGELLVTDANGFDVILRGFPWEEHDEAKVVFLNSGGDFSLELKVKGKESLQQNGVSYESWKLQIGLNGLLGNFFPKSYYWYSVNPPHYLIRAESAGMQGREASVLELIDYSAGD